METVSKKEYFELDAYQKTKDSVLIKGKLFLSKVDKIFEKVKDNVKDEFFIGKDLNEQNLFIIRETVLTAVRRGKETIAVENCDLFVMRVSPNVIELLKETLSK